MEISSSFHGVWTFPASKQCSRHQKSTAYAHVLEPFSLCFEAQAARLAFLAFLAWRSSSRRQGLLLKAQLVRQRRLRLAWAFNQWSTCCECVRQMRQQLVAFQAREEEDTRRAVFKKAEELERIVRRGVIDVISYEEI